MLITDGPIQHQGGAARTSMVYKEDITMDIQTVAIFGGSLIPIQIFTKQKYMVGMIINGV